MEAKHLTIYKIRKKRQKSLIIALAIGILCLILIFRKQSSEIIQTMGKVAMFLDLCYLFFVDSALNIKSVKLPAEDRESLDNLITTKPKKKYRLNKRGQIIFKKILPVLLFIVLIAIYAFTQSIVNVFISVLVLILLFLIFEYFNF